MASPEPIVTVRRPQLTPEEREARLAEVKRAVAQFYIACLRSGIDISKEVERDV